MDLANATTALAALVGALTGLSAGLAYRISERQQRRLPEVPEALLPDGIDTVLALLRSSAVVLGPSLQVLRASPAAYAFGVVRDDRLAVRELTALGRQVARDGEIRQAELEIARGPRGEQPLYVSARLAPLPHGMVLMLVEDRTHAHRMDEVRRDFVANVSHELKTPVGALFLLAEAVGEAADDPTAVRRFAQRMQGETGRLTRLVQEIIDLSRLQYDDPVESAAPVSVDEVVAEAVDRARVDADAKNIRLVTGGDRGLKVLGDEQQLVMALGNLVDNAVAYSPERTRVAVGVRRRGDSIQISVTDQGIGIPESELGRIFERFYRVDPARSRATGGTGLGLAIAKHIAASHGGELAVWSIVRAGSTFTLTLPMHRTRHEPVPIPPTEDNP